MQKLQTACEAGSSSPNDFKYLVMRVKLMSVVVPSDTTPPDATFGAYDARYFSVGAHVCTAHSQGDALLPWWTVNARMLEASADSDGFAHVFFLPPDDARALQAAQARDTWDAPALAWGERAGRVLGVPDFGVLLRYRVPSPGWEGSPANAPCFATPEMNQPLAEGALGDFTPELFGCDYGSLDEFLNASSCGALVK